VFGVKHPAPLFLAPVGVQGIWHADAELAGARAAKKLGVPFILSTVSSCSIQGIRIGKRNFNSHW
jgi:isopentenyl diphosphate isomerase/L-lactate dehydrogenase-like FMN-dependent dehydrogenase